MTVLNVNDLTALNQIRRERVIVMKARKPGGPRYYAHGTALPNQSTCTWLVEKGLAVISPDPRGGRSLKVAEDFTSALSRVQREAAYRI